MTSDVPAPHLWRRDRAVSTSTAIEHHNAKASLACSEQEVADIAVVRATCKARLLGFKPAQSLQSP